MKLEALVNPAVLTQPVYEPGKPIDDVARELGINPATILKLASNENPFGPSPRAVAAAKAALEQGQLYPDGACLALRQKLASRYGLKPEQFAVGNGSNELLELLGHVFLMPGDEVVMAHPSFIVYRLVTLLFGAKAVSVPLRDHTHDLDAMARAITPKTKLVYVGCPNNPTGTANSAAEIEAFARALPEHVVLALDEAYAEFQPHPADLRPLIAEGGKVVCLRTFSKVYGLASLRVGYGYGPAGLVTLLNRVRQPFNVNAIAQAAAIAALDDERFVASCVHANAEGLKVLQSGCDRLGLKWVPSEANFLLIHVGEGTRWFEALQRRGVIVRPLVPYSLPEWIRITVGTPEQNERVLQELAKLK
ncbi:MAG TPA: histidinol-phosphate transaminase [Opitutaceae bacterium]|jgi:histidinol-phosphate aminotransferase